ncbi:MAG TPA: BBE domain-containing protein [Rhodothermales bacterium]|nr:BBE domain-containing protein [Rhodothermales bacterium]
MPGDSNYDAAYVMNVHGRWDDPTDDQNVIGWAREFFAATTEFASGSVYVNFVTDDEPDRIAAAYGPNHERLAKIKAKYDPDNLFRTNQNIRPAV